MAQLVEQSVPTPEVPVQIQTFASFICSFCQLYRVDKINKKRQGIAQFKVIPGGLVRSVSTQIYLASVVIIRLFLKA